jgi:hypothetical protein
LYLPESEDDLIVKQLLEEQRGGTVVRACFINGFGLKLETSA